jgi:hypothetical protein
MERLGLGLVVGGGDVGRFSWKKGGVMGVTLGLALGFN